MRMREWTDDEVAELVGALGAAEFPHLLLGALHRALAVNHLTIIAFDHDLAGHVVAAESVGRPHAKAAQRIYESVPLHRHDPNVRRIERSPKAAARPVLFHLRVPEIANTAYRRAIFEQFGLIERLSAIEHFAGRWHAINVYRDRATGPFKPAELRRLRTMAGLIVALVAKHRALAPRLGEAGELRPPVARLEGLLRALSPALTPRQIEVCARALAGSTNSPIADDLGIRPPTVATLRKRAYASLRISSLNELFALCLAQSPAADGTA